MFPTFDMREMAFTQYLFFTGKGGVGKTSTACAVAVWLADHGKRVLLVSTDPASNLQDVFDTPLNGQGVKIEGAEELTVANLDPMEAAKEYRESVVAPYRGVLPDSVIVNMEEQLSGSCTVEIAAFDQFSHFITDKQAAQDYDHIIFDTAPTGHTLRMLQLPSAWSNFISESTHGASCLGQLAGLEQKKGIYALAVKTLSNPAQTTLILVSRPETAPLLEAARSSAELQLLGVDNQMLLINAVLSDATDAISREIYAKQQAALSKIPDSLADLPTYSLPLRSYNVLGLANIRAFFERDVQEDDRENETVSTTATLRDLADSIHSAGKHVVFTMGKGGVGKTTVATVLALLLAERGAKVHLTSTDPAYHLDAKVASQSGITVSRIDEKEELHKYQSEVLARARETMSEDDVAYVEEDLRSPCTQEIAVFRAFAEIVDRAREEIVVIDTAPTGHTLLLLDATQSYHREVQRTKGEIPPSVGRLLPRLRDALQTEVVIVTLPEATPVFEAERLREDLQRAGIENTWWVVNQCLSGIKTDNAVLAARARAEGRWIQKVDEISQGHTILIPWNDEKR